MHLIGGTFYKPAQLVKHRCLLRVAEGRPKLSKLGQEHRHLRLIEDRVAVGVDEAKAARAGMFVDQERRAVGVPPRLSLALAVLILELNAKRHMCLVDG